MIDTDVLPRRELEDFCRKWHLTEFSVFGSVVRPDFDAESDIDVIVDFMPGHVPGFAFARLCREIEEIVGRPVDVLTRASIEYAQDSPTKRTIRETAVPLYVRPR